MSKSNIGLIALSCVVFGLGVNSFIGYLQEGVISTSKVDVYSEMFLYWVGYLVAGIGALTFVKTNKVASCICLAMSLIGFCLSTYQAFGAATKMELAKDVCEDQNVSGELNQAAYYECLRQVMTGEKKPVTTAQR